MRLFFSLDSITEKSAAITVMTGDFQITSGICAKFKKVDGKWTFIEYKAPAFTKESLRVARQLSTYKTDSAMVLIDHIREDGGRQVVLDKRLEKYRNVTTMKDDDNMYVAEGVDGVEVSAPDEKSAAKRIQSKITDLMVRKPESAADLAAWFSSGRPVTEVESGEAPQALQLELLANEGEKVKKAVIKTKLTPRGKQNKK